MVPRCCLLHLRNLRGRVPCGLLLCTLTRVIAYKDRARAHARACERMSVTRGQFAVHARVDMRTCGRRRHPIRMPVVDIIMVTYRECWRD